MRIHHLKYAPFYLLSLLPIWFLQFSSRFFYVLVYLIIGYRKKVVRQNLTSAFPDKNKAEIRSAEKRFYLHFCELFLLSLKVLTISRKQARKRLLFKNLDLLNNYHKQGRNVVLYGAHMGNWEWYAFFPLHIKHQFVSFYQEQSNAYFNELTLLMRQRFGNICVESRSAYKQLVQLNREGTLTLAYIIGDQSPMANSGKIWTQFLSQDTAFLGGADRIAKKGNQVILYPYVRKTGSARYEIEFIELDHKGSTQEVIDAYAQILERNISEQTELWLWTHRRWKLKKDQETV